jgi:hypothetical protein
VQGQLPFFKVWANHGWPFQQSVEAVSKVVNGEQAPPPVYYQPNQLANFVVGPRGQVLVNRYKACRTMLRYRLQPLR